jgi:hypothetical protein
MDVGRQRLQLPSPTEPLEAGSEILADLRVLLVRDESDGGSRISTLTPSGRAPRMTRVTPLGIGPFGVSPAIAVMKEVARINRTGATRRASTFVCMADSTRKLSGEYRLSLTRRNSEVGRADEMRRRLTLHALRVDLAEFPP